MTREETEISLWTRVYHEAPWPMPADRKHHADEALKAFREAFPNDPHGRCMCDMCREGRSK